MTLNSTLASFLTLILSLSFSNSSLAETPAKFKVGAIVGLSGSMANAGTEMKRGMDLAMDDLKANGRNEIEIIFEDDESMEHKIAVTAISKLINVDKAKLILNWVNTTMPTIMPIATKAKIPVIEFWDSNDGMFSLSPYVYSSGISTEKTGHVVADFAVKEKTNKKIGIIVLNDPWSELIAGAFKAKVLENKAEMVFEERIDIEEKDVRALVLKLRKSAAEGVFLPLCMTSLYSSVRQLRELGYTGNIYIADCMVEDEIKVLGKFGKGAYVNNFFLDNPDFKGKYSNKYKTSPSGVSAGYAGLGYDAVMIIDAVLKELDRKGLAHSSENIKTLLDTFTYEGVTGKSILKGTSVKVEEMLIIRDGRFEKVQSRHNY